jgi:hypothetical protein
LEGLKNGVIDYVVATTQQNPEGDVWYLTVTTYLNAGDLGPISGYLYVGIIVDDKSVTTSDPFDTPYNPETGEILTFKFYEVSCFFYFTLFYLLVPACINNLRMTLLLGGRTATAVKPCTM